MRRVLLALVPVLASCGLLMDFDPGGAVGDGGGGAGTTSLASASTQAGEVSSAASMNTAASSSTGEGAAGGGSSSTSSSSGGSGGSGGGGGPAVAPPWTLTIGGAGDEHLRGMAVAPSGRVAIAGDFTGNLDFGSTSVSAMAGMTGTFVASYDPGGNFEWAAKLTEYPGGEYDRILLSFDNGAEENLTVAGSFVLSLEVPGQAPVLNEGPPSVFAVSYDKLGGDHWHQTASDPASQVTGALVVDAEGRVFMTGWYCGTLTLPGCGALPSAVCESNVDIWLARLDGQTGACQQAVGFPSSPGLELAYAIDVSSEGEIALAGEFDTTLNLGGDTLIASTPGTSETFVARLNSGFQGIASETLGALGPDVGVLFDGSGLRFFGSAVPVEDGYGDDDFIAGDVTERDGAVVRTVAGGSARDGGFLRRTPGGGIRAYGTFRGEATIGQSLGGADAFIAPLVSDELSADVETFGGGGDQKLLAAGFDQGGNEFLAGEHDEGFSAFGMSVDHRGGADIFVIARALDE